MIQKTKSPKINNITRIWHLFDIKGKVLGRAASEVASLLRGKAKPYFVSNLDCGDYVVVINTQNVRVTGKKSEQKIYTRYSGYPGGLKTEKFSQVLSSHPERIIRHAVRGMLPDNKVREQLLKRLYIYPGSDHPYKDKFIVKRKG